MRPSSVNDLLSFHVNDLLSLPISDVLSSYIPRVRRRASIGREQAHKKDKNKQKGLQRLADAQRVPCRKGIG
jgi:hypothetical protein